MTDAPTTPAAPARQLYALAPAAEAFLDALKPLAEWRKCRDVTPTTAPALRAVCDLIDRLAAEGRAFVAGCLEPFPHPGAG